MSFTPKWLELNVVRKATITKILPPLAFAGLVFLASCATPGVSNHQVSPPEPKTVDNERVINEPFDVVWDRLVRGLSRSFYVINNIEKQSRIINVSFSSDHPEYFIDCGRSVRTYHREVRGEQIDRTYEYQIAASSRFLVAGTWLFVDRYGISQEFPETTDYTRTTALEGRVNIYVAPRSAQQTDVAVNARYVLNIGGTATVERENAVGMSSNVRQCRYRVGCSTNSIPINQTHSAIPSPSPPPLATAMESWKRRF